MQSVSSSTYTPSVIASTGGNLNIGAKGPVTIDGSVVAAAKDLGISGSSVAFTTEQNSTTQSVMHKDKSIGLTGRVSPNSVVGQIINTALAATQTSGKGGTTLATLNAMQGAYLAGTGIAKGLDAGLSGLTNTSPAGQDSGNIELAGVQAGVGLASNKRSVAQTDTSVVGATATATAGGTLSVVARGDNASDVHNGDLSAVAAQLAGQDVVLAAQKDMSLSAGWNSTDSDSKMSSNNAFVGVDAGIGTSGAGVSVTASVGLQNQHVTTSSRMAVDTTVKAGNSVTLSTPGAMTLNGAEVSGPRVDVSAGSLSITSPQNTSDYKSTARQAGASISVPVWGAGGKAGGGASYSQQNVTDHFATTEDQLSGFYAGSKGLGVDVAGNTALTAGVLSSTADARLNHFTTASLRATDVENISRWDAQQTGASFSAGAGMFGSTMGILGSVGTGLASGASGLMGGGRTHDETSVSQSAIGGNITVSADSVSGSYTTDVTTANAALTNMFDAQKLSNQLLSQQMGSQLVGEVGGQVADKLNDLGVAGFDETNWKDNYGRALLETAGNTVVAAVTGGNVGAVAASTAASNLAVSITAKPLAEMILDGTGGDKTTSVALSVAVEDVIASFAGAAGGLAGRSGSGTSSINALNGAGMASSIAEYNYGGGTAEELIEGLTILGGLTLLGHAIISHNNSGKAHDDQNTAQPSQSSSSSEAVGADSLPPHDEEPNNPNKGDNDPYSGGPHKETSKPTGDGLDSHHCPAKSCSN